MRSWRFSPKIYKIYEKNLLIDLFLRAKILSHGGIMTIYIEYAILDNLIIDILLLKATFFTTKTQIKGLKIFFGAVVGTAFALIFPLFSEQKFISLLAKICLGFLIVLLAGSFQSFRGYIINTAVFFCYTFLCGGAVQGIFNLLGLNASAEISVALMILPVWALVSASKKLVGFFYKQKTVIQNVMRAKLVLGGIFVEVNGLMDTGNNAFSGDSPIIICGRKTAQKFFTAGVSPPKLGSVEINTVNGKSKMICFQLDHVILYQENFEHINYGVTLCVAKAWGNFSYEVILHPSLTEKNYVKKTS